MDEVKKNQSRRRQKLKGLHGWLLSDPTYVYNKIYSQGSGKDFVIVSCVTQTPDNPFPSSTDVKYIGPVFEYKGVPIPPFHTYLQLPVCKFDII
jgi:hypothetical protein